MEHSVFQIHFAVDMNFYANMHVNFDRTISFSIHWLLCHFEAMQHGAGMMTSPPQAQPQQQHPAQSMMATTQMSMTFPAPPQMQQPQQMHPITLQNTQPVKYPGAHQVFQPQEVPQVPRFFSELLPFD